MNQISLSIYIHTTYSQCRKYNQNEEEDCVDDDVDDEKE